MPIEILKGRKVISRPQIAHTQWQKARGLMFAKQHDVLFRFPTEQRLKFHMVFVFYPIDIVFLDDRLRVVDLKRRFRPFTFYYSKARSSSVIESYDGFIDDYAISIGDRLTIREPSARSASTKQRSKRTTSRATKKPRAPTRTDGSQRAAVKRTTTLFVASKNASSYHRPSCRHARSIPEPGAVRFSSKQQARRKGYVACKACRP